MDKFSCIPIHINVFHQLWDGIEPEYNVKTRAGTGFLSIASVEVCDIIVHSIYEEIKVSDTETSDQIQFKLPACPTDKCPDGTGLCTIKVWNANTIIYGLEFHYYVMLDEFDFSN